MYPSGGLSQTDAWTNRRIYDYPSTLHTGLSDGPNDHKLSYGFKHLYRVVRTLQTSVKSSIRIDRNGVLSIQFLLPEIKGKLAYIDFLVSNSFLFYLLWSIAYTFGCFWYYWVERMVGWLIDCWFWLHSANRKAMNKFTTICLSLFDEGQHACFDDHTKHTRQWSNIHL